MFRELEGKEMHAIDKLKVTQNSHGAMQVELEQAMARS